MLKKYKTDSHVIYGTLRLEIFTKYPLITRESKLFADIREYINEFHKEWIERTRQSIAFWSKQPMSLEEKRKQQERLNQQKAIREGKQKS